MSSIIDGYNYDIFISYRQKDNKGDRWVSEFVESLKTELESTFKEEISVYFDINPHDGLLETHDVDASLKDKLKCLVFIPIISRTYCDPKSFAWEHEFKAFVEQASQDQFGLKVKTLNGNVANRVLPVRIHDLDAADIKECESVLGGVLRGVELIYKEPGIDKPLAPGDNEKKNLNNTIYRIQIIKVSHAIKEIILGLRADSIISDITQKDDHQVKDKPSEHRKSIIVLPFANLSPNHQDEYFSDGLTEEIITNLAHLKSLRVISRSTSMLLKGTTKDIMSIGHELEVNYVLEGSVRKSENKIRITAQLIKASTDEHLWAEKFDGTMDDIFDVQDQIAGKIVEALKIELSPGEKSILIERPINNPKAYDIWILAKNEFHKLNKEGIERGIYLIRKAMEIEGDNAQLWATLGYMHWGAYDMGVIHETDMFDLMEQCVSKSLAIEPKQTEALYVKGLILYKKGNLPSCVNYMRPAADLGGDAQWFYAFLLSELGDVIEADKYVEYGLATDPLTYMPGWARACVYLFMGKADKAYSLLKEVREKFAPGEPFIGWWLAQMAAYSGDNESAHAEFKKIALSDSLPWKEFCKLFQLALDNDRKGVIDHLQSSMINDISKTDEYYPLFIANALTLVNEIDEALVWLKRAVDWGFSNYKFLSEFNRFMIPLRRESRFLTIIEQAFKQQVAFINLKETFKSI
jgi:TolB-like protein